MMRVLILLFFFVFVSISTASHLGSGSYSESGSILNYSTSWDSASSSWAVYSNFEATQSQAYINITGAYDYSGFTITNNGYFASGVKYLHAGASWTITFAGSVRLSGVMGAPPTDSFDFETFRNPYGEDMIMEIDGQFYTVPPYGSVTIEGSGLTADLYKSDQLVDYDGTGYAVIGDTQSTVSPTEYGTFEIDGGATAPSGVFNDAVDPSIEAPYQVVENDGASWVVDKVDGSTVGVVDSSTGEPSLFSGVSAPAVDGDQLIVNAINEQTSDLIDGEALASANVIDESFWGEGDADFTEVESDIDTQIFTQVETLVDDSWLSIPSVPDNRVYQIPFVLDYKGQTLDMSIDLNPYSTYIQILRGLQAAVLYLAAFWLFINLIRKAFA